MFLERQYFITAHQCVCMLRSSSIHDLSILFGFSVGVDLPDWSVGAILVAGFLTMLLLDHLQQAMVGGGHAHAHAHAHTPVSSHGSGQSIHRRHSHLSDEDIEEDITAAQKV